MRLIGVVALGVFAATPAAGQWPPQIKNLQVFPKEIRFATLVDTMRSFTRALGVRCQYCHVGREGMPLDSFDFASDTPPGKAKARTMMRMVAAINGQFLPTLAERVSPATTVTCITCHRGVTVPRPIHQVILSAYQTNGVDSAIAAYRGLRARYYGAAAYDFGEVPLSDVADAVFAAGKPRDALRFNQLDAELLPASGFAFRQLGFGHLRVTDTASALTAWRKRLELQPDNPEAKELLESIAKKP